MRIHIPAKWFTLMSLPLLLLLLYLTQATSAKPDATSGSFAPAWDQVTLERISASNTLGSEEPLVRVAPNGTLVIAYKKRTVTTPVDYDLYYSRSTNNGSTWSPPAPLYAAAGSISAEFDIEFDSSNIAHAVWAEDFADLAYAKSGQGASSWPGSYDSIGTPFFPGLPDLVISEGDTLDVVWQNLDFGTSKFRLNHARKEAADFVWTLNPASPDSKEDVLEHSLAVDGDTLHLVWSESAPQLSAAQEPIKYSQGTVSGSPASWSWSPAITLTNSITDTEARRPVIVASGGQIQVVFSTRVSANSQQVYYRECTSNCTNIGNWSGLVKVSGADLAVSTDPREIYSDMVSASSCTYLYFHGKRPGGAGDEDLWGARNCGQGWSGRRQVPISLPEAQTLKPSLVIDSLWMHLAFERAEDVKQVYYIRGNPNVVYMPVMMKN
jgi:hypothetical protein